MNSVKVLKMARALSKSRFQLGLQCEKQLWLKCHKPDAADPITEVQQHIFDSGTGVGELARERFPGGVLVAEDHLHSAEALAATARLMADPPPALFEAAFSFCDVLVRTDVLVRAGDAWDLYEVKSSTRVKPENISDVAVQLWVLEGAGLKIRRVCLMHIDNTYVYQGGEYDLERLFAVDDVTGDARSWQPAIPELVARMFQMLEGPEPALRIGKRCDNPYTCGFYGYCHAYLPERPITDLPRVSDALIGALLDEGIACIDDVPPLFPGLTLPQRTVCETLRRGTPRFDPRIASVLAGLSYPVHFLDFETIMPALPLYPGTRPYQQIPFQWSDHVLAADGTLEHREFLYDGDGDPRPGFVGSLLAALGEEGSVVVYHAQFETARLRELADALPAHAAAIQGVLARIFDLEKLLIDYVQHPGLLGRSSIKVAFPALVGAKSYDELEIQEGGTASLRYLRCAQGVSSGDERAQVFADLREYCAMDTRAMVELHRVLGEAVAG